MAKLADIVSTILNLDKSKDYDFSVNEVPAPTPDTTPDGSTIEQPTEPQVQPQSKPLDKQEDISALRAEIEKLKKDNQALLSRTPANQEPSIEELIYNLCVPARERGGSNYASDNTGHE